jgi:hypothetical protein
MATVLRVGGIALPGDPTLRGHMAVFPVFVDEYGIPHEPGPAFMVRVELFAELDDGRRVVTNASHGIEQTALHGTAGEWRPPDQAEIEDAVRSDFVDSAEVRWSDRSLPVRYRAWLLRRAVIERITLAGWSDRRERWSRLRDALKENGVRIRPRQLDRLPFTVEVAAELRSPIDP